MATRNVGQYAPPAAATVTLDLDRYDVFEIRPAGNFTVAVSNASGAPRVVDAIIRVVVGGTVPTITWPGSFTFRAGAAVPLETNTTYEFHIRTWNGGTGYDVYEASKQAETALVIDVSADEATAIAATGTKKTFRMPFPMTVTAVRGALTTAATTGTFTVDVNEAGTSILSTKLTFDATEKTTTTAAAAAVISDAALADDAEITIDVDDVGAGDAAGLKVTLVGVAG